MGEKLLTAKEAAEILKVRKNTVYDMIKRGDLKASKSEYPPRMHWRSLQ